MLHLEKFYTDIVCDDATVAIIYSMTMKCIKIPMRQDAIELFLPDGQHRIYRNPPDSFELSHNQGDCHQSPSKSIDWQVLAMTTNVSFSIDGKRYEGKGYKRGLR